MEAYLILLFFILPNKNIQEPLIEWGCNGVRFGSMAAYYESIWCTNYSEFVEINILVMAKRTEKHEHYNLGISE